MKYIYKITNTKNGKIYIGQSSDPEARFTTHMSGHTSKSLQKDIEKYGRNCFKLSILKCCGENFRNDEIQTILEYKNKGYNLYNSTIGGEEPPTFYGESHPRCIYTDEQRDEVVGLLHKTNLHYTEIADVVDCSVDFVRRTNNGQRPIDGIKYTIRVEKYEDVIADYIVNDLFETNLSQRKIAEKYGVSRSMVTMINIGKNRHKDYIDYPIREKAVNALDKEFVSSVLKDFETMTAKAISKKYNKTIYCINSIIFHYK